MRPYTLAWERDGLRVYLDTPNSLGQLIISYEVLVELMMDAGWNPIEPDECKPDS